MASARTTKAKSKTPAKSKAKAKAKAAATPKAAPKSAKRAAPKPKAKAKTEAKAKAKAKTKAKPAQAKPAAQRTRATRDDLIKVALTDRGEDTETPWALDLGPAGNGAPKGSRRVRLVNVPFFHAKPTWGDVVVVSPVEDGLLTWDAGGIAFSKIGTRIAEDGGRFAMIVDYIPRQDDPTGDAAFAAINRVCHAGRTDLREADLVCEGAYGASDGRAGRVYLAVVDALEPDDVMQQLRAADLPCDLIQIHPEPPKQRAAGKATAKGRRASGSTRAPRRAARP